MPLRGGGLDPDLVNRHDGTFCDGALRCEVSRQTYAETVAPFAYFDSGGHVNYSQSVYIMIHGGDW